MLKILDRSRVTIFQNRVKKLMLLILLCSGPSASAEIIPGGTPIITVIEIGSEFITEEIYAAWVAAGGGPGSVTVTIPGTAAAFGTPFVVASSVAAVVTVGVMAAIINTYAAQQNASIASTAVINQTFSANAAAAGLCSAWSYRRNQYREALDEYNLANQTCNSSFLLSLGSLLNSNCYGLTAPAPFTEVAPANCNPPTI